MTATHAQSRARTPRLVWVVASMVLLVVLTTMLDWRLFHWLAETDPTRVERLKGRDWYQFLRAIGYLPAWGVLAFGIALCDLGRRSGIGRGLLVVIAPIAAGAAAELAKLVISRERPIRDGVVQNEGSYTWKGLFQGFVDGGNLGMPSSHAAVAFGGAAMLGILFPPVRWLALLLAAGCGLTRLLSGAHFASDVAVGAVLGVVLAWLLGRSVAPRPGGGGL
ncbi:MAG: phosphatase PAP2 family protein [Phycisphaerales bacterium JB059]